MAEETAPRRPELEGCFYADVLSCARCGEVHRHTLFYRFIRPPEGFTHYGICPKFGEPMLLCRPFTTD